MTTERTYAGSCHCGAVAFEAAMPQVTEALSCNCSYCGRKGTLLAFIPKVRFKLIKGNDNLTEYRFNTNRIRHLFCSTCGVQAFGFGADPSGTETAAINVRCLEGIDLSSLAITEYNGKDA